ncbi:MAG: hypothetical protein ACEPOZ_06285 [Marinifilaceae bacterium]
MERIQTNAGQGLGIAGLILGILAFLLAFIPCVGLFALVPGVLAIILSSIGLTQARRHDGAKGLNIGALSVSIIGTCIALVWLFLIVGIASLEEEDIQNAIETIIEETSSCNPDLIERVDELEQQLDSLDQITIEVDSLEIKIETEGD